MFLSSSTGLASKRGYLRIKNLSYYFIAQEADVGIAYLEKGVSFRQAHRLVGISKVGVYQHSIQSQGIECRAKEALCVYSFKSLDRSSR